MLMKLRPVSGMGRLLFSSVLVFASVPFNGAAQTNAVAKPKAPTGFYVSGAEISPTLSVKFGTNGEVPCGNWALRAIGLPLTKRKVEVGPTEGGVFAYSHIPGGSLAFRFSPV
jgi:hypothetical protein